MDIDTIIEDYLQNRANKRRSKDSVHFELHWERDLVRLLDDVNDRSLDPLIYSFVRTKPRPREVIAGLMQMKIIQQHFDNAVRPLVEKELTDRTFNNRIGFGGGYYDRYLAACDTKSVAIAFDEQQCEPFDTEKTDIRPNIIITPTRVLEG